MSRTASGINSGQVAGRPTSSIYTILLVVALVFMVVAAVVSMTAVQDRFGFSMPFGESYTKAKADLARQDKAIADARADIQLSMKADLTAGTTPAAVEAPAPVAPAPAAPEAPAAVPAPAAPAAN